MRALFYGKESGLCAVELAEYGRDPLDDVSALLGAEPQDMDISRVGGLAFLESARGVVIVAGYPLAGTVRDITRDDARTAVEALGIRPAAPMRRVAEPVPPAAAVSIVDYPLPAPDHGTDSGRSPEDYGKKYTIGDTSRHVDIDLGGGRRWIGTVFQIRATKDIRLYGVNVGARGGWVADPANLSQDGDSWVAGGAMVVEGAVVEGDALVDDAAIVAGDARVSGSARVRGEAVVRDRARVCDDAVVRDRARMIDDAVVRDRARVIDDAVVGLESLVCEAAEVGGAAKVFPHRREPDSASPASGRIAGRSCVGEDAEVLDAAELNMEAKVDGHALVCGQAYVSGRSRVTDRAQVRDNAKLFDDAAVRDDAMVYGDAQLRDESECRGSSRAHGTFVGRGRKALYGHADFASNLAGKNADPLEAARRADTASCQSAPSRAARSGRGAEGRAL